MEKGKIGGIRIPKPLNRLSQNSAWVITSAIWLSKPKLKPIAPVGGPGKWVKYHSRVVFNFSFFVLTIFAPVARLKNRRTGFYAV